MDMADQAAGGALSERTYPDEVINDAGRYLVTMHDWAFLNRPSVELALVNNQPWIELPKDCAQVMAVESSTQIQTEVTLTTQDHIDYLRSALLSSSYFFWVAVTFRGQRKRDQAAPGLRLEVYPTPGESSIGELRLSYRAGWMPLIELDQRPNIPDDVEPLLVQLVRLFALGYEDEQQGQGSVAERLKGIRESPIFLDLARRYGMSQWNLGKHKGGKIEVGPNIVYRPFRKITRA